MFGDSTYPKEKHPVVGALMVFLPSCIQLLSETSQSSHELTWLSIHLLSHVPSNENFDMFSQKWRCYLYGHSPEHNDW